MSAPTVPPPPSFPVVVNLVAQIGFGLLVMTICLPSMQDWGRDFEASQARVQLSFSLYLISFGCLQVLYGPLSDRYGRRPILIGGLVLTGIASVLCALATDLNLLIAGRALQGAGTAAGMVAGRAMIQDLFPGPQKTRVMAFVGMAMGLCPPLGTILGGQVHARWGWQANFLLLTVCACLLALAAWRGLPARVSTPRSEHSWLQEMGASYARLAREPAFLLNVAILSMTVAAFYAFLSGAPVVLKSYGVGPADVGWYIMAVPLSYIGGNFLTSRLVHSLGERRIMALGQGFSLAGVSLMVLLGVAGVASPLAFNLPLLLLGVGHGLLMPACLAGTVGLIPALAGAAAAVAGVTQQLVGAAAGYAVGWVSHQGSVNLGLLMLGFTLAAIAAQGALHRQARPPGPRAGG